MIKFFRKIRQKMLTENKFSKYLLYAIGEIVLVVIGILIALSINNWNDRNNAKKIELLSLNELKNNLKSDIIDLENNIKTDSLMIISFDVIINNLTKTQKYNDSLAKHFGKLAGFTNFLNNSSAYESLKSNGLNKIINDTLRFKVINYYDLHSNELKNIEKEFINNAHHSYIKPYLIEHFLYYGRNSKAFPNDYSSILNDKKLLSIIESTKVNYVWKFELTKNCLNKAKELLSDLQILTKK